MVGLSGCDLFGTISTRSGTIDDDYVEEPLSGGVEKYDTALVTSNNILNLIAKSKYPDIYRIYFSDTMKAQMTSKEFKKFMIQVKESAGPLKAYKQMQWNFFSGTDKGLDMLYSVKIAEHEKLMMKYLFVFEKDKPYINLIGFFVKQRQGVSTPGQF
jgi:plasmid maintenance system killer protein